MSLTVWQAWYSIFLTTLQGRYYSVPTLEMSRLRLEKAADCLRGSRLWLSFTPWASGQTQDCWNHQNHSLLTCEWVHTDHLQSSGTSIYTGLKAVAHHNFSPGANPDAQSRMSLVLCYCEKVLRVLSAKWRKKRLLCPMDILLLKHFE